MPRSAHLAVLLLCAASASAAAAAPAEPSKVTIAVHERPLGEVLSQVARDTGVSCHAAPEIAGLPISLNVLDVPLRSALWVLARLCRGRYMGVGVTQAGQGYELTVLPVDQQERQTVVSRPMDPRLGKKPGLDLKQATLKQALDALFEGSGATFVIAPEVPETRVDFNLSGATAFEGLQRLVALAARSTPGLILSREKGVYRLEIAALPSPILATAVQRKRAPSTQRLRDLLAQTRVTADFRTTPLRRVVDQLFAGSEVRDAIGAAVPDVVVRLKLQQVPLREALDRLLASARRQAPGLDVESDGDVVVFDMRSGDRPAGGGATAP